MDEDERKEIEELKEVMDTLKTTVPELIKGIMDALYSGQNAEEFGKQVAEFYRSMIAAGMEKKEAYELTKEFMESRNIAGVIKSLINEGNPNCCLLSVGKTNTRDKKEKDVEGEM